MTIKQKIWDKLDKDGYCTDSDLAKIYSKEPNFSTAEEYKRSWCKLQSDKDYFEDKEIAENKHYKRSYMVRLKGDDNKWYKVGKDFYKQLTSI